MPHLHIKEFKTIELPAVQDEVHFNFIADNANHQDEKLIATEYEGEDFFLLVKEEEGRSLLKTDKLTRPASIYNVHRALLAYAKAAGLEVIASNVPQTQKNVHLQTASALKKIDYFANDFPREKEVRIEVGFGSGRHLLHQAANNPDILFIGIEIHRPSIEQVLKQVVIQKLDNVMVLDYDARLFMELVPSNIVGAIYVHFPVPWDKKPHRRVISTSFIQEARRVLKEGGTLELRTDSENYYAYSYETFIAFPKITLQIKKNHDIAVSSKYEDRWKKMEKNIYDVIMVNDEISPELVIEGDFSFEGSSPRSADELLALHNKTIRFDGGFIHFERVYKLTNGVMLRISMGSFDRPEHLYLIITDNRLSYYPQLPLRSPINLEAHKHLLKAVNG
ncbi:tRNA (guanosine(46)-N7)-methyltransferase TrmB [Sulfurimonas paralvinellae]|uniref:tRNA (guanine-N(7)-)-methyltransferase n=1 Tax=Sulfurimonas paralvinellae TaxID=317658 RepID=A0A7M1B973_9BACT|nr:tRNA (guanosine(46)-N7)-methyltransferase TrmB [Sulfurimonas paralvinellae]QOP45368.1 tRNA (guanosine(46)-N7)-methyltransferase TrmB [Sulfurimonas paralvinellae]